jgi:hypothetical protein
MDIRNLLSSSRIKRFLWLVFFRRWFQRKRLGTFWCDKHWKVIENSQLDLQPIDPAIAAAGIAAALYLKGIEPEFVRKNGTACCILNTMSKSLNLLDGIFERSRGWIPIK